MKCLRILFLMFTSCVLSYSLQAQKDTITFGNGVLQKNQLSEGSSTYLVYRQENVPNAPIFDVSVWTRTVEKQEEEVKLDWYWYTKDSADYVYKSIIVNALDFHPKTEQIKYSPGMTGQGEIRMFYHFRENALVSDPDTNLHNYTAMNVPYPFLAFCWELDLETFSMLPFEEGKEYVIPFYHPGGSPPAFYHYHVDRTEKIALAGHLIDCWVIRHYHEDPKEYTEWWVNKKTFKVVKMKSLSLNTWRYKYLISS